MANLSPAQPLLGLLARGETHGYELRRAVEREFAPFWRIDFAQLYRSLAKMKRAGWVLARSRSSSEGPERKTYALTERGRQALDQWLVKPAVNRDEFFVKLALAAERGISCESLIAAERKSFEAKRAIDIANHRSAREQGSPSMLLLAHAALKESEASLAALDFGSALVPVAPHPVHTADHSPVVIAASDDPLLGRLAQFAPIAVESVGSIGGLMALAQHQADLAGAHLLDKTSGEYNIPFVRHLLPEDDAMIVNLAWRETGLIVARGNPKNIRGVRDLSRPDVRLINRTRGTGTRLLLFEKLRRARIDPHTVQGWDRVAATHDAVAGAIAAGAADVGPGLRAVAHAWQLDFIPLSTERYDLIIPRAEFDSRRLRPMLESLHSREFRRAAAAYLGYDLSHSGSVVARVK